MYPWLAARLPRPLALALTLCAWLALLGGIVWCALEPQAEFRYMNL